MPEYKLTYFDARGRAEPARWLLAQAGAPYQDERIAREKWAEIKPTMPMGQMPVLTVDGKAIAQSMALTRFLARQHGLAGKDNLEMAQADMFVDGVGDLFPAMRPMMGPLMSGDMAKAKEEYNKFKTETFVPFMDRYTKFLDENHSGWLVGSQMTWADLVVAEFFNKCLDMDQDLFSGHPKLRTYYEKIVHLPNIKKWLANRPPTQF